MLDFERITMLYGTLISLWRISFNLGPMKVLCRAILNPRSTTNTNLCIKKSDL